MKWHVDRKNGTNIWIWDEDENPICEMRGKAQESNATLIATVPELLSSLKWALGAVEKEINLAVNLYPEQIRLFMIAKETIAKVEGK